MNKNEELKREMMNTILAFVKAKGRDTREQAVRAYIKQQFPMNNEREQMLWVASAFRTLKEEKAVVQDGANIGLTWKGRMIAKLGNMDGYFIAIVWMKIVKVVGGILSVVVATIDLWQNVQDETRTFAQYAITLSIAVVAGISIYSLMRFLLQSLHKHKRQDTTQSK